MPRRTGFGGTHQPGTNPRHRKRNSHPGGFLPHTSLKRKQGLGAGEGWGIGDNVPPAQKNQQVAPNKAKGASGEIDLQQHMCLKGITLKPLSRNQSDKERRVWRLLIEEEAAECQKQRVH